MSVHVIYIVGMQWRRHDVCVLQQYHGMYLIYKRRNRENDTRFSLYYLISCNLAIGKMQVYYKGDHFFLPFFIFIFVGWWKRFSETLLSTNFGNTVVSLS